MTKYLRLRNLSLMLVVCCARVVYAQQVPDNTDTLRNDIWDCSKLNPTRTTLETGTYYVRNLVSFTEVQNNLGQGLTALANTNRPLIIKGKVENGIRKTRIVAGIGVDESPYWHTWNQLKGPNETTGIGEEDPWKYRFPTSMQSATSDLRWVDLDELNFPEPNYFFTQWWTTSNLTTGAETDTKFGPSSIYNPICATINGFLLKFASNDTGTTNWDYFRALEPSDNNVNDAGSDDWGLPIRLARECSSYTVCWDVSV